jgi:hypothetical protein
VDGGTLEKSRRRKAHRCRLVVKTDKEIFNLFDPDAAALGEQIPRAPLLPGIYEAECRAFTFRGKEVQWVVVLDERDGRHKGKVKRAWEIDAQNGGVTFHE